MKKENVILIMLLTCILCSSVEAMKRGREGSTLEEAESAFVCGCQPFFHQNCEDKGIEFRISYDTSLMLQIIRERDLNLPQGIVTAIQDLLNPKNV